MNWADSRAIEVDGNFVKELSGTIVVMTESPYLFANNNHGTASSFSSGIRIYSAGIARAGAEPYHFIPVRRGNTGYMYSITENKLYENRGAGDFIMGPDITPVEYLESTGTQWIDTGLPIVNNTGYQAEVEFRFLNFTSGTYAEDWVFGYWNHQPSPRMYLIGRYTNYIRGGAGPDNSTYYAQIYRDTNKHKIALMNDGAYLDGVYKAPTKLNELADPIYGELNVLLGKSPHVDNGSTRQIYSCKMWSIAGSLLRDFIPVRVGTVGYMYDKVSHKLFGNQGTGDFIYGPDTKTLIYA